jgi:4-hydroxybenzoate polyprenyltransferase
MDVSATAQRADSTTRALPLTVDMDGTLLRTDTLFEAIAVQFRQRPFWTLLALLRLPFAIARVKLELQRGADIDVETLPVNDEVLAYCREARGAGRPVWLVSAADQSVVAEVAARFDVFGSAVGSDGVRNNKGSAKARQLEAAFPGGFEYIGDSPADMKVWRKSVAASHVGGGAARRRAIERSGTRVERSFARANATLRDWVKALRLHQWAKNALILVAPVLAMKFKDPGAMLVCLIAIPLLGLLASGTYIINDLLDLSADRRHRSKHRRPFAAGRIKLWQGFVAAPLLIIGALAAGYTLSPAFAAAMLVYLGATLLYSLALKRIPLLDVMVLASLYTLRLWIGAVLVGAALSEWLIVFSMFLFASLSLAKRHLEIIQKAASGEMKIANRGYSGEDAALTLGLGLSTATATPMILVLYLIESAWPSGSYAMPEALWVAPVVLSLWLMRVWLLASRMELNDDPVIFAIKDPLSLVLAAVLAGFFMLAVIGPPPMPSLSLGGGAAAALMNGS